MGKEDVVHINNGILLSKWSLLLPEQNNAICSNMDEPRDDHTKWNQTEANIKWCHLYVESKEMIQMNFFTKTEIESQM